MDYHAEGILMHIGPVETFGAKNFPVRKFVLHTIGETYPQMIPMQGAGQKYQDIVLERDEGKKAQVKFDISGNEHGGKFYCNLNAFRVTIVGEARDRGEKEQDQARQAAAGEESQEEDTDPPAWRQEKTEPTDETENLPF